METTVSLDKNVFAFIGEAVGRDPETIGYDETLLGDLGMDGDDAREFFENFARQYQIDMTDFRFSDHFGPEGWPLSAPYLIIRNLIGAVRGKDPHEVAGLQPIKVYDMLRAARARKWIPRDKKETV